MDDVTRAVGENLHFDVAGSHDRLFQEDGRVTEGRRRFACGGAYGLSEISLAFDEPQASPAAARRRLHEQRKAHLARSRDQRVVVARWVSGFS